MGIYNKRCLPGEMPETIYTDESGERITREAYNALVRRDRERLENRLDRIEDQLSMVKERTVGREVLTWKCNTCGAFGVGSLNRPHLTCPSCNSKGLVTEVEVVGGKEEYRVDRLKEIEADVAKLQEQMLKMSKSLVTMIESVNLLTNTMATMAKVGKEGEKDGTTN